MPVAPGMPTRGGYFEEGVEYTGLPYSSVKSTGRYIGFDIYLKTFLAALENPDSVLYTENLAGEIPNAESYYGTVCSAYTSYAYQCGIWYLSWYHGPTHQQGVELVKPANGQTAQVGDVIFRPSRGKSGSHVQLVTEVFANDQGVVTHVRVDESTSPLAKATKYSAEEFNDHLNTRGRELYRITDPDAWRAGNRANSFQFPNYQEDTSTPTINRVVLLDRGDWVAYQKDQSVRFNILDKDDQGVKSLVIEREGSVIEKVGVTDKGIVERTFEQCGNYTAHCVLGDNSLSQECEFSVCDLDFSLPTSGVPVSGAWDLDFHTSNMNAVIVYFRCGVKRERQHTILISEEDRTLGKVEIPDEVVRELGNVEVWLIGENKYGRLKKRMMVEVKDHS
ncbi:C40 family peptidase [Bremerella alba]|nr:C40 family peptidase [Bremerella alba]